MTNDLSISYISISYLILLSPCMDGYVYILIDVYGWRDMY